jgi:hypothetical protein
VKAHDPISSASASGVGIDQRFDRILMLLERLEDTGSRAVGDDAVRLRLTQAAQLVEKLASITPELQQAVSRGGWDACDAVTARVVFAVYDRAVRELRAVALEARGRIERAEAVLAEAREFSRRRRRCAAKIAATRSRQEQVESNTVSKRSNTGEI